MITMLLFVSCSDNDDNGASALCNDGTYSYSDNCSGTCSWHDGVKKWYVGCWYSSKVSSSQAKQNDNIEFDEGVWVGTWINNDENLFGKFRLNITDNSFEGSFLYDDNSIESEFHSQVDDNNGELLLFIDIYQGFSNTTIEYPANMSLTLIDNMLIGNINIKQIWGTK